MSAIPFAMRRAFVRPFRHSKTSTVTKRQSPLGRVVEQLEDRSVPAGLTWDVQSDYFDATGSVSQTRSLRGLAITNNGGSVIGSFIQGTSSWGLREVNAAILTTTQDSAILGNFNGSGSNPSAGNPVYTGGSTGALQATYTSPAGAQPKSVDTDDRGYVYVASEGSSSNFVRILNSSLTSVVGTITGFNVSDSAVSVQKLGSTYFAYVKTATGTIQRYDVTNPAAPTLDSTWGTSGSVNLQSVAAFGGALASVNSIYVDTDGVVFVAGGTTAAGRNAVFRIPANGDVNAATSVALNGAMDLAVFRDKLYVTRYLSTTSSIAVLNKADLSSGGADLTSRSPT